MDRSLTIEMPKYHRRQRVVATVLNNLGEPLQKNRLTDTLQYEYNRQAEESTLYFNNSTWIYRRDKEPNITYLDFIAKYANVEDFDISIEVDPEEIDELTKVIYLDPEIVVAAKVYVMIS